MTREILENRLPSSTGEGAGRTGVGQQHETIRTPTEGPTQDLTLTVAVPLRPNESMRIPFSIRKPRIVDTYNELRLPT